MDFRIITKIAWFVAGLLAIDRSAGWALDAAAERVTAGDGLGPINRALTHRDAELLVLGSSRAVHHVDPAVLTRELHLSAYNAGRDGQGIYYARMLLALFLEQEQEQKPKTRVLLVQAEPMDLYEGSPLKAKMFAPYVDRHPIIRETLVSDFREEVKFMSRIYRYNAVAVPLFLALARGASAPPDDDGFLPLHRSMANEAPLTALEVAPGLHRSKPRIVKGEVADQYRALLAQAKDAGLRVIFFSGPRWRTVAADPKEVEAWEVYKRIAREGGAAYVEIDEHSHPDFQDGRFFDDHSHLNQEGAEMFSRLLAQQVAVIVAGR